MTDIIDRINEIDDGLRSLVKSVATSAEAISTSANILGTHLETLTAIIALLKKLENRIEKLEGRKQMKMIYTCNTIEDFENFTIQETKAAGAFFCSDEVFEYALKRYGAEREYCPTFDAYFVKATGEWLEKGCSDSECEFCADRPEEHSPECEC